MEQSLVNEGFPPSSIQELCEVHVEVFEDSLKKTKDETQLDGHPVHTFRQENREAEKRLNHLDDLCKKYAKGAKKRRAEPKRTPAGPKEEISTHLDDLFSFEKHYQRKENQLFPKLENVGFTGPTSVMWGKHDEIRDAWKTLRQALEAETSPQEVRNLFKTVKRKMEKMIFMEEKILFPTSLKKLTPADWASIRNEEQDIGYSWVTPGSVWDPSIALKRYAGEQAEEQSGGVNIADYMEKPQPEKTTEGAEMKDKPIQIPLNEGIMTQEQLDLMLRLLPFDLTFVDENDKVRYYSATDDRVFPRTPAIIGRDVQKCHPPKSVHVVKQIVDAFKKKERDRAEFWITLGGRTVYIRYFPVFDTAGNYRGVIEVSQDITEVREITGERRLLDWE